MARADDVGAGTQIIRIWAWRLPASGQPLAYRTESCDVGRSELVAGALTGPSLGGGGGHGSELGEERDAVPVDAVGGGRLIPAAGRSFTLPR